MTVMDEKRDRLTCGSVYADKPHCPYLICTEGVSVQRGDLPLPSGRVWCLSEGKTRCICIIEKVKVLEPRSGCVPAPDFCPYRRDGVSWETDAKACGGGEKG